MRTATSGGDANRTTTRAQRRAWALVGVIVVAGVIASVGAASYWSSVKDDEAQHRFGQVVKVSAADIGDELHRYEDALKTTRGLFAASDEVEPDEFAEFARSLSLRERYPGAEGVAFLSGSAGGLKDQVFLASHGRSMPRRFGRPGDPVTRAALERSRDSGRPALGESFLVDGHGSTRRFALYVPVYRNHASTLTVRGRRDALLGWLGAAFRGDRLIDGALGFGLQEARVKARLNPSAPARAASPDSRLTRTTTIDAYGRDWPVRFTAASGFRDASDAHEPWVVLLAGLLLSLALAALVSVLTRSEARALRLVREATATLRESEERFRLLASSAPIGIYETDRDGGIVYSNAEWQRIFGISFEQSLGSGWKDAIDPADREAVLTAEAAGEAFSTQFRVQTPEGVPRWVHLRSASLHGPGGSVRGTVGSVEDITARKKQEEALRRSEERYRGVVESTSEGVWTLDLDNATSFTNGTLAEMLRWEPDELTGRSLFDFVEPADRRMLERGAQRRREGISDDYELKLRRRDGSQLWARLAASPLTDEKGCFAGSLVVVSDVSRRKRAQAQQAAVADFGQRALGGLELPALLEEAVSLVAEILDVPYVGVLELLVDEDLLLLRTGVGWGEDVIGTATIPAGGGSHAGFTLLAAEPVVVRDMRGESRFTPAPFLLERGIVSGVTAPILTKGRPFGVLGAQTDTPREFNSDETNFLQSVANVLGAAIERSVAEEDTRHRALHDPLTGLPNRALFLDRLEVALAQSRRQPRSVTVLFLDLDRFKLVNDSLGHECGDQLLLAVAERLQGAVRAGDTVARLGGDEFTVLCEDISEPHRAVEIADRAARAIEAPIRLDGCDVVVTTSIGIAIAGDGHVRPGDLLRDADAALYRAKDGGRARYELFDDDMRVRALERLNTESALRHALVRDELRLHYQPTICLESGRIVGVEALIRWQHPERGLVPPLDFIPIAEETGLIMPIGTWVIEEACQQLGRWRTARPDLPLPVMAVNLSARQLMHPSLPEVVARAMAESQVPGDALCLEITETVLMAEAESSLTTLEALKALGVRLAVDDFGTGYSSLSYLKRFPVDILKVDRSFVDGLGGEGDDGAIVAGIVSMGHALGLTVVAEGVETGEQTSHLRMLGSDHAQGFYFARPQCPETVGELLCKDARGLPAAAVPA